MVESCVSFELDSCFLFPPEIRVSLKYLLGPCVSVGTARSMRFFLNDKCPVRLAAKGIKSRLCCNASLSSPKRPR